MGGGGRRQALSLSDDGRFTTPLYVTGYVRGAVCWGEDWSYLRAEAPLAGSGDAGSCRVGLHRDSPSPAPLLTSSGCGTSLLVPRARWLAGSLHLYPVNPLTLHSVIQSESKGKGKHDFPYFLILLNSTVHAVQSSRTLVANDTRDSAGL